MKRAETKSDILTAPQLRALEALLSQPEIGKAAQAAGVSRPTLWRWLQDETFSRAYRDARRGLLDSALIRLEATAAEAVSTLREVMQDETAQPSARVAAARCSLELLLRLRESVDLEGRILALESRLRLGG